MKDESTDAPRMEVHITLQPPVRAGEDTPLAAHIRRLKGVPFAIAQQMATDFARSEEDGSSSGRKLYTYHRSEGQTDGEASAAEVLVALDFGDVQFLKAVPGD